jgi:hypothetical protein
MNISEGVEWFPFLSLEIKQGLNRLDYGIGPKSEKEACLSPKTGVILIKMCPTLPLLVSIRTIGFMNAKPNDGLPRHAEQSMTIFYQEVKYGMKSQTASRPVPLIFLSEDANVKHESE